MNNDATHKAQYLLYSWMSRFEKRSYTQIKEACDFLNTSSELMWGERPIQYLFYPLLNSGVIDHVGKDYYALTRPVAIDYGSHAYLLNNTSYIYTNSDLPIGWQLITDVIIPEEIEKIQINTLAVLKSFPSIDKVVDSWHTSLQDESELSYHDYKNRVGVAEYKSDGFTRYFSIPQKNYMKEMPSRSINPDAYRIGICLERCLTGQENGLYCKKSLVLKVQEFAFPIMLYRTLALDGLKIKSLPLLEDNYIVFENITFPVIKQLNRILYKSIRYE